MELTPGLWRSLGSPAAVALVDGEKAILIDAPAGVAAKLPPGVKAVTGVLLTHHHRDTVADAAAFGPKVPVRAPKSAAEWLTPEAVRKFWVESIPLRSSRTAYFVVPVGLPEVTCDVEDGTAVDFAGWSVKAVATPGHSRDHTAYALRKGDGPLWLAAGDALASAGKLWTPYTTDWDHWTDAGLKPTAESLRKLAALKPAGVIPSHGPTITKEPAAALEQTAAATEEVGFLKSFERFTKQRLKDPPQYAFLAKEQAESNGSKPWTKVSEHLWLTGNTYVLVSKEEKAFLVFDPWGKRSAEQVALLREREKLGALEVVVFSHAHYDHYDGVYDLPGRESYAVWSLDSVAGPLAEPFKLRAPFLDARPVRFEKRPKDGESLSWREYRFRFHDFPGQSLFTMAVETAIDGKRCLFTADNFFHQDMFSGSGGWMGLNRSNPPLYAASARKVLDINPEWVLAEHGGPFEYSAEDFRRRARWGDEGAKAADAVCVSGDHRRDWSPHRVRVEPALLKAKAGTEATLTLHFSTTLARPEKLAVSLEGRGVLADFTAEAEVSADRPKAFPLRVKFPAELAAGRHVFTLRTVDAYGTETQDAYLAADVER
jgi:glyoxylase-like metal-dependent hydrolase (beta-lactamase superfamily II)